MIGSHSIGAIYPGGYLVYDISENSERSAEVRGTEGVESERDGEVFGTFRIARPLQYHIIVKDENGVPIGEVHKFRNLNFSKRLNDYGSASFEMIATDPKAADLVSLRQYTVDIYREQGFDNELVWSGEQALRQGSLLANRNNWITVHCFDWLEQLNQRYTSSEVTYLEEDAGQIAWDLINDTQSQTNGSYGITQGTIEVTMDRDRTYRNDNIMEAIIALSNVISGFDFEITNEKVFNVRNVIGTDKTDSIILMYGHNITNMKIIEDFIHPVNRAIVLGEATDASTLQRVDVTDTGLRATYKLRESRIQEMDVSELATFQDKGEAAIRKFGTPLVKVDFELVGNSSPHIGDFGLGDGIRLVVQEGLYNINTEYRIFEYEVTFDTSNVERISLVLGTFTL